MSNEATNGEPPLSINAWFCGCGCVHGLPLCPQCACGRVTKWTYPREDAPRRIHPSALKAESATSHRSPLTVH